MTLPTIAARMRSAEATSMFISQAGQVSIIGRWGLYKFPTSQAFNDWLETGQIPESAAGLFCHFDPYKPS